MYRYSSAPVSARLDTTYPSPATIRVAVVGELDLATATVLRDRLLDLLFGQDPAAVLEVDLAGTTFMDCTGLSALIVARNAAVQTGRRMRVCHPQPIVHRVLAVTGLLDLLAAPFVVPREVAHSPGFPSGSEPVPAAPAPRSVLTTAA
jgi:anti-sigma B factor antagonist